MLLKGSPGTSMCSGVEKVKQKDPKKDNNGVQERRMNLHRGSSLPHTQRKSAEIKSPRSCAAVKIALETILGST